MPMNPELKAKWVEALKSGKYNQGRSYLKKKGNSGFTEHCCLGVLCEVAEVPGQERYRNSLWVTEYGEPDGGSAHVSRTELPLPVREKVGITLNQMEHLIGMNDGHFGRGIVPRSFNDIADWIQGNL